MFRRIIAPQVLRFALPGLGNLWQVALKDSSLISVTGLTELMRVSQVGAASTHQPFAFYLGGLVLYLADDARHDARLRHGRGARDPRHAPHRGVEPMDWGFIGTTFWRLMAALPLTLEVWFLSVVLGGLIAAGVTWMRVSGSKPLEMLARAYVAMFRGTPLLIQLFIVYYGLASLPGGAPQHLLAGCCASRSIAACWRSALCTAGYQSEIFRGALLAVPHGAVEAARACGMSWLLLFRRIIFPIALRHALPAYSTEMISMVKATALVSLITLWDVLSVALKIRNDTLVTYLPLILAGAIYFTVNYILGAAFLSLERRLSPHLRAAAELKERRPWPPRRPPSPSRTCASASARSRC